MQAKNLNGKKIVDVEIISTGYVKLTLDDGSFVIVSIAFFGKVKPPVKSKVEEEEVEQEEEEE